jgi:hypothetical protein
MNITYTREYSQVAVSTEGELNDIVKSFYCNIIGVDSDSGISVPVGFKVDLTSPDPSTFVKYNDLTQEIFDEWVDTFANPTYYESVISDSIYLTINPPTTIKDLPF